MDIPIYLWRMIVDEYNVIGDVPAMIILKKSTKITGESICEGRLVDILGPKEFVRKNVIVQEHLLWNYRWVSNIDKLHAGDRLVEYGLYTDVSTVKVATYLGGFIRFDQGKLICKDYYMKCGYKYPPPKYRHLYVLVQKYTLYDILATRTG